MFKRKIKQNKYNSFPDNINEQLNHPDEDKDYRWIHQTKINTQLSRWLTHVQGFDPNMCPQKKILYEARRKKKKNKRKGAFVK